MSSRPSNPGDRRVDAAWATALFLGSLLLYHLNGDFQVGNDAVPNLYLPISLLRDADLAFTPDEAPHMFSWKLRTSRGEYLARVQSWRQQAAEVQVHVKTSRGSRPTSLKSIEPELAAGETTRTLRDAGRLVADKPDYYLVPSVDPPRRGYVGTFGPGAGLTALPVFALLRLTNGDLSENKAAIWYGGKFVAAFCVALSVAVVFLGLRRLVGRSLAVWIALAYGAGTCVWAVSSQTLWQSGPDVMAISIAAYCLIRVEDSPWWSAGCGASAGWSVLCRPTSALLVLSIGGYLAVMAVRRARATTDRVPLPVAARPLAFYVLAGLPMAVWLGFHHWYYLGSPFRFPDLIVSRELALQKVGAADVWSGSFWEGLSGLLWSPSRGMLVFSPVLLFSLYGMVALWRHSRWAPLRPLCTTVVLVLLVSSKWYDWPGGWSFGYRLMVDTMPLVALCAAPTAAAIGRRRGYVVLFGLFLILSVAVQVLGAFAYDLHGWNARKAYLVTRPGQDRAKLVYGRDPPAGAAGEGKADVRPVLLDIDQKPFHRRLWMLGDSQLLYYASHFVESRRERRRLVEEVLRGP